MNDDVDDTSQVEGSESELIEVERASNQSFYCCTLASGSNDAATLKLQMPSKLNVKMEGSGSGQAQERCTSISRCYVEGSEQVELDWTSIQSSVDRL